MHLNQLIAAHKSFTSGQLVNDFEFCHNHKSFVLVERECLSGEWRRVDRKGFSILEMTWSIVRHGMHTNSYSQRSPMVARCFWRDDGRKGTDVDDDQCHQVIRTHLVRDRGSETRYMRHRQNNCGLKVGWVVVTLAKI